MPHTTSNTPFSSSHSHRGHVAGRQISCAFFRADAASAQDMPADGLSTLHPTTTRSDSAAAKCGVVVIGHGSVLSMGVYIGNSTRIFDRESGEIMYGRVPPGSVVVPGSLPSKDGSYSLYAAIIVKRVDEQTRSKTSVNELLRASVES